MDDQIAALMRANLHEIFGQRDPGARWQAAERTYAGDVAFTDEEGTVHGREAVIERAEALLNRVPADFAFTADSPLYAGGDQAALAWRFGAPGAEPAARGIDIATVTGGRISALVTLLTG
jgi:SnoaL-like domain